MKKGDWIFDGCNQIGKAKSDPYDSCGRMHVDVTIYSREGIRVGRTSPSCGGPKHFEPACTASEWVVIKKPKFPIGKYANLSDMYVGVNA